MPRGKKQEIPMCQHVTTVHKAFWRLPTDRTRPTRRDDVRSPPPARHRRDMFLSQVRHVVHAQGLCVPPPAQAAEEGPRAQNQ